MDYLIFQVTDAILFLGELLVIGLSALAAWRYCVHEKMESETMYATLVIVVLGALLLTICFFSVLRTAIDTVFLCVLEDYERNDGMGEAPYLMSSRLQRILFK